MLLVPQQLPVFFINELPLGVVLLLRLVELLLDLLGCFRDGHALCHELLELVTGACMQDGGLALFVLRGIPLGGRARSRPSSHPFLAFLDPLGLGAPASASGVRVALLGVLLLVDARPALVASEAVDVVGILGLPHLVGIDQLQSQTMYWRRPMALPSYPWNQEASWCQASGTNAVRG